MPLVKVELVKGKNRKDLIELKNTIMNCVQEVLKLPKDDTNIRVIEHDAELFTMKKPYELLIEISLFAGRTKETKKGIYGKIVNTLETELGINKNSVFILLNEQPLENWGVRGGIPADEIKLDFKVNI